MCINKQHSIASLSEGKVFHLAQSACSLLLGFASCYRFLGTDLPAHASQRNQTLLGKVIQMFLVSNHSMWHCFSVQLVQIHCIITGSSCQANVCNVHIMEYMQPCQSLCMVQKTGEKNMVVRHMTPASAMPQVSAQIVCAFAVSKPSATEVLRKAILLLRSVLVHWQVLRLPCLKASFVTDTTLMTF